MKTGIKMKQYSIQEFLAVLVSRDIADGEKVLNGTNTDIQIAACNLAMRMQAPSLTWISGPGGTVNSQRNDLVPAMDWRHIASSEAIVDLPAMVDFIDWQAGFFDFAVLSAIQVDMFGNINTCCIGAHAMPLLRGPGTVGISALCGLSRRFNVVMTNHTPDSFVEKVDFVTGAGYLRGGTSRADSGLSGGPRYVFSPLGIFDFHPVTRRMRILSLHKGVTVADVAASTSFAFEDEYSGEVTAEPSEEELGLLREFVDSTGVLRAERRPS